MALKPGFNGFLAEINVTPFVDVMLVLLIIFMVTAPLMTQGLEVDLPRTRTVDTLPQDAEHLVLTINRNSTIFLDEYEVPLAELSGHVQRLVTDKKKQLYLRADKEVTYGLVVQVMGEVKTGGVDKLGVVAQPPDDLEPAGDAKPAGKTKNTAS